MFETYKWRRRLKGGEWHLIIVKSVPGLGEAWINRKPNQLETALKSEYYLECDRCGHYPRHNNEFCRRCYIDLRDNFGFRLRKEE